MTRLSIEGHAHAVRNEMSSLALTIHRLTADAGTDLSDALAALADIEEHVTAARRVLLDLPTPEEV